MSSEYEQSIKPDPVSLVTQPNQLLLNQDSVINLNIRLDYGYVIL